MVLHDGRVHRTLVSSLVLGWGRRGSGGAALARGMTDPVGAEARKSGGCQRDQNDDAPSEAGTSVS
jgi:hypothetical protein